MADGRIRRLIIKYYYYHHVPGPGGSCGIIYIVRRRHDIHLQGSGWMCAERGEGGRSEVAQWVDAVCQRVMLCRI